jgi:hypothetical protein
MGHTGKSGLGDSVTDQIKHGMEMARQLEGELRLHIGKESLGECVADG